MSLLLGPLGRKILDYAAAKPNAALVRLSKAAGRALHGISGHYTVGLSIETYGLWKVLQERGIKGGTVKVAKDGFYVEGEKLAGDENVSAAFLSKRIDQINIAEITSPEKLANMPRELTFAAMNKALNFSFPLIWLYFGHPVIAGLSLVGFFGCKIAERVKNRDMKDAPRPGLIDIERFHCPTYMIPSAPSMKLGFAAIDLQAVILFQQKGKMYRLVSYDYESMVNHEKAHLLGASELEAYSLQNALDLKRFFSGEGGVGSFIWAGLQSAMHFPVVPFVALRYALADYPSFLKYFDSYTLMRLSGDERGVRTALDNELEDARVFGLEYAKEELAKESRTEIFENLLATYDELIKLYTVLGKKENADAAWSELVGFHLWASDSPYFTPKEQAIYAKRGCNYAVFAVLRGRIGEDPVWAREYYEQLKVLEGRSQGLKRNSVYSSLREHLTAIFEK
ncbi:MAG: hypothetical protein NT099_08135 [Candidatus Saganbacteria bacterium]|nr:hypothetical protein [Candidatus Saganbacteria bacterium]